MSPAAWAFPKCCSRCVIPCGHFIRWVHTSAMCYFRSWDRNDGQPSVAVLPARPTVIIRSTLKVLPPPQRLKSINPVTENPTSKIMVYFLPHKMQRSWTRPQCQSRTTPRGIRRSSATPTSLNPSSWKCHRLTRGQISRSTGASTGEERVTRYIRRWWWKDGLHTPCQSQGGHSLRRLWEGAQGHHIQAAWGGPEPAQLPGAAGARREETHLQQDGPGLDNWGHPLHPPHHHPGAHESPRVRRPVGDDVGCNLWPSRANKQNNNKK